MADFDWIKQPLGIIKLIAWVLSIAVLGLFFEYGAVVNVHVARLIIIIVPSTCLVLTYFILSYILDGGKPGKNFLTEMTFDVVHAITNIAIGGYVIDLCSDCGGTTAFGAMAIILAAVLIADAVLTFMKRE